MPERSWLRRAFFRLFLALERLGLHVLPRHFYSPIADRRWLTRNAELWRHPTSMPGVDWDLDAQLEWLADVCSRHVGELTLSELVESVTSRGLGFRYGEIEAQVLHCVVRRLAPSRIVEVGAGASTVLMAAAGARNEAEGKVRPRFDSFDPFADPRLDAIAGVDVHRVPAQALPVEPVENLGSGDLLFIDSTHVLRAGSELPRLYLELVPRLAPGVLVQIHDVYFPYMYSPWVACDLWDWQETVLVAALLTNNPRLRVLCCQSALHASAPEAMREILPEYRPLRLDGGLDVGDPGAHYPSGLWLEVRE